jgi:hypothetical protein
MEVFQLIFQKYKLRGLIAILIMFGIGWLIIHYNAAPGSTVKYLGLIEYTKTQAGTGEILGAARKGSTGDRFYTQLDILPVSSANRIYVNKHPIDIAQSVVGFTDLQAEKIGTDLYSNNKWFRVKGRIDEVTAQGSLWFLLSGGPKGIVSVVVDFDSSNIAVISHLKQGD